jgi:hypothetical protein
MKYIYNQTQGIGDILFLIPMAKKMVDSGHEILWPVRDDFMWIQDYIDFIEFIPQSSLNINYERYDVYNHNGYDVLPLRFANPLFRGLAKHDYSDDLHCMLDKYIIFGYYLNIWRYYYIQIMINII